MYVHCTSYENKLKNKINIIVKPKQQIRELNSQNIYAVIVYYQILTKVPQCPRHLKTVYIPR